MVFIWVNLKSDLGLIPTFHFALTSKMGIIAQTPYVISVIAIPRKVLTL